MAKTLEQERLAFEEDARRLEERRRKLEEGLCTLFGHRFTVAA